jgi:hypothetical protein
MDKKSAESIVGGLFGGGGAGLIGGIWMIIHGFLVPDFLYWNIYWTTSLVFVLSSVIIIIVGLRFRKKYQIPWVNKEKVPLSVALNIIVGIVCILLPVILYGQLHDERIWMIKPYLEKEFYMLCLFCEISGAILIVMGLLLKKKYKITFLKKKID